MKAAPHAQVGWRLGKAGRVGQTLAHRAQGLEQVRPGQQPVWLKVVELGKDRPGPSDEMIAKRIQTTLILLNTHAGTDLIAGLCKDPDPMPDPEGMAKAQREPLLKIFPPALLCRRVAIPYCPLAD